MRISKDGETWYEVSGEEYERLLADPSINWLVDLSGAGMVVRATMDSIRQLRAAGWRAADPNILYGRPTITTED